MNITTERISIRKFSSEDWQDVNEYTSDSKVMKYIPEGVFSKEDAKEFVNKNSGETSENFPVILKKDNILVFS